MDILKLEPGLFCFIASYLSVAEFTPFHTVITGNTQFKRIWTSILSKIMRNVWPIFSSYKELKWVISRGINARDWKLELSDLVPERRNHQESFLKVCEDKRLDVVNAIFERTKIDVNYTGAWRGLTALHYVCRESIDDFDSITKKVDGQTILEKLLEYGANPSIRDTNGWTPVHYAAYYRLHPECLKILVKCTEVDKEMALADGRTLLHLCIEARNEEAALYLINAKANIEARTVFRRRTPLFHATLQSMEAVVQRLIDANADVNVEDSIFATPLRHAIEAGNLEICKIIVSSNRVDKHFVGNQGTVAEIAFYEGNIDILKYLVCDAGFDPHLDDDELFHAYTQMQSESEEYPDHFSYVLIFAQGLEVCHNKGYVLSPLANSYMDTIHREIPLPDQVSWEIGCKWWVKPNKCQNDESVWANYVMDETQH